MARFSKILLIAALMFSIGAQWVVLQSAAWVHMAVAYSLQEGSVTQGLSKTFDGKHPCALCKAVNKGSHSDKKAPAEAASKLKLCLFCDTAVIFIATPTPVVFAQAENEVAASRIQAPPAPPPRGEAAIV